MFAINFRQISPKLTIVWHAVDLVAVWLRSLYVDLSCDQELCAGTTVRRRSQETRKQDSPPPCPLLQYGA